MNKVAIREAVGDEPIVFIPPITDPKDIRLSKAYNYYNYVYAPEEAVEFIVKYMKLNLFSEEDVKIAKSVKNYEFKPASCWIAAILNNGNTLPAKQVDYLKKNINEVLKEATPIDEPKDESGVRRETVQDRIAVQASDLLSFIEPEIDKMFTQHVYTFSLYDFLSEKDASSQAARYIQRYFEKLHTELQGALNNVNDTREFYRYLTNKQLKGILEYLTKLLDECIRWVGMKKSSVVRKPRKAKVRRTVEQVAAFKYLSEDKKLKVTSVHPTKIVGSSTVWLYSTKKRVLMLYKTEKPIGLRVGRSKIYDFDPKFSIGKKLRKPAEVIEKVLKAGKVSLKHIMDEINAKPKVLSGRVRADTLILRVI